MDTRRAFPLARISHRFADKCGLEVGQSKKPKFHIFGHIHEGYGMREKGGTVFTNVSLCDANYDLVNEPVVIEL